MPFPTVNEIKAKQAKFKERFNSEFKEVLNNWHDVSIGKASAATSSSSQGDVTDIIAAGAEKGIEAIPGVGKFASLLISVGKGIYHYFEQRRANKIARKADKTVESLQEGFVVAIIEETAHEIARAFEYQIAMLRDENVAEELASFAVERITAEIKNSQGRFEFSSRNLINTLITSKAFKKNLFNRASGEYHLKTLFPKDPKWDMFSIFTETGLRIEHVVENGCSYQFKTAIYNNVNNSRHTKYGYRSQILYWDVNTDAHIASDIDAAFNRVVPHDDSDQQKYVPISRLITQEDFDIYCKESKDKEFNEFLQARYGSPHELIAVFRNIKFAKDSKNLKLSNVDLLRVKIIDANLDESLLNDSYMVLAYFEKVEIVKGDLKEADARWGIFKNVDLSGKTNLTQTKLNYGLIDKDCDLRHNATFALAKIDNLYLETEHLDKDSREYVDGELIKLNVRIAVLESSVESLEEKTSKHDERIVKLEAAKSQEIEVSNFTNLKQSVEYFTGREQLIKDMKEYFDKHQHARAMQLLYAMPGMGKTQIALEYFKQYNNIYEKSIRWMFNCESATSFDTSYKEFAEELKVDTKDVAEQFVIKSVNRKLIKLSRVLLIFDNVENAESLNKYLPQDYSKHDVIITSRDKLPLVNCRSVNVEIFQAFEAKEFITNNLGAQTDEDYKNLEEMTGNLPLALVQAVAYIKYYSLTVLKYKEKYNVANKKIEAIIKILDTKALNDPYTRSVYTTFTIAINKIKKQASQAVEMLMLCGYLASENIPAKLFEDSLGNNNEFDVLEIVAILKKHSLITVSHNENGDQMITVHRLLQKVIRIKSDENKQKENYTSQLMSLLFNCFHLETKGDSYEKLKVGRKLSVHIDELLKNIDENIKPENLNDKYILNYAVLNHEYGTYLNLEGLYNEALEKLQIALKFKKKYYGKIENYDVAATIHQIGNVLRNQGKYNEAYDAYDQSLAIKLQEQSNTKPLSIAASYHQIGKMFKILAGDIDTFKLLKAELVSNLKGLSNNEERKESDLSNVHFSHVTQELIKADNREDLLKLAFDKLNKALKIKKDIFGEDHIDVAATIHQIGNVYKEQEKYDEALEQYKKALKIQKDKYKTVEHTNVPSTIHQMGNVYKELKNYPEALTQFKEALRIKEKIYFKDHPEIASTLFQMGNVYCELFNFEEASSCYEQSLKIKSKYLDHDHKEIKEIEGNIVKVTQEQINKDLWCNSEHELQINFNDPNMISFIAKQLNIDEKDPQVPSELTRLLIQASGVQAIHNNPNLIVSRDIVVFSNLKFSSTEDAEKFYKYYATNFPGLMTTGAQENHKPRVVFNGEVFKNEVVPKLIRNNDQPQHGK